MKIFTIILDLLNKIVPHNIRVRNPGFVNKAPEAKVNEEKAKLENYKQMLQNVEERLKSL